jgi:peptidoglycan L-alanyl-D-glutamate endopeptidase CwlK
MSITLGERSLSRLQGVHADLVRVVKRAAAMSDLDFTVLEGLRTVERQKQLVAAGASKTPGNLTFASKNPKAIAGGAVSATAAIATHSDTQMVPHSLASPDTSNAKA